MAFHREIEGPDHGRPAERLPGRHEWRPAEGSWQLAVGTLACPACDAPVLPALGATTPSDLLACAYCRHDGPLRDFLSLTEPTRPTRVSVRVRQVLTR